MRRTNAEGKEGFVVIRPTSEAGPGDSRLAVKIGWMFTTKATVCIVFRKHSFICICQRAHEIIVADHACGRMHKATERSGVGPIFWQG